MMRSLCRFALTVFILCAGWSSASAQFSLQDLQGRPIMVKTYTDVQGSPYLSSEWGKGTVTLTNGTAYDGLDLLYDQVSDELLFKGANGQAQTFVQPISEFTIQLPQDKTGVSNRKFRRGYIPVDAALPVSYYEVLADGNTQLLKRTSKKIFEETPYGSATKVKSFQESPASYYIAKGGKLVKIKREKKSVFSALKDKTEQLEKYVKENKLDLKKDADLASLITYYNGLQ